MPLVSSWEVPDSELGTLLSRFDPRTDPVLSYTRFMDEEPQTSVPRGTRARKKKKEDSKRAGLPSTPGPFPQ